MEIKRDAYLQQLTLRKDNGMIKVITGIRRCGKSFLQIGRAQRLNSSHPPESRMPSSA